jgi:transcriptional regulator with XRE-family HTH domain
MDELQSNLAEQIQTIRKQRHMQQDDLAHLVGVTRTSISNIERGKQALSLSLFCKIAQALDRKPCEFLELALTKRKRYVVNVSRKDVGDPKIRKIIKDAIQ